MKRRRIKSIIIILALFTIIIPVALFGLGFTANSKRKWKSFISNLVAGLIERFHFMMDTAI